MTLLASTAGDVARYALAAFLLLFGIGLAYMLFQLGGTFSRLSSFIRGTERELLPKARAVCDCVSNTVHNPLLIVLHRRDRGTLGGRVHLVWTARFHNFADEIRGADTETDAQSGESERFGQRSSHQHRASGGDKVRKALAPELRVRLIDDHQSRCLSDDPFHRFP